MQGGRLPWAPTTFTIHDYSGPAKGGTREIVALTELNGATWYFKLIGPTDAVTAQNPHSISFWPASDLPQ